MRARLLIALVFLGCAAAVWAAELPEGEPLRRIAFGSCDREYKPQLLWPAILQDQPQLWIWLGDIVYGRADDLPDLARRYSSQKAQPDYTTLRQQAQIVGVWDDNDYGVSNGGADSTHKAGSQKLLLDFLDEPSDSPRRAQAGVYAAYTFGPPGQQVKVILLDGRYHRTASDPLGAEQWLWLEQQLAGSTAELNLIGSGIQVIPSEHPFEKWANFPGARSRLFDLIAKTKARNVIILSGDRHLGEISRGTDPRMLSPLYDITSSGMTHHATDNFLHHFKQEANRFRIGSNYVDFNFGLLLINWDSAPPTVTAQIRGVNNVIALEQKIPLAPAR